MNNITLLGIELIICLIFILLSYKYLKILGLHIYTVVALILSNMMSLKVITIYNFDVNLGLILFVTIFIATNIMLQKKGQEEVKKNILILILTSIIAYFYFYLVSIMDSSTINLFTNKSYDNIFLDSQRIYFALVTTMLYTTLFNSKLYYYLKRIKNKIWISNLFSSIIIQFLSATLFILLAYTFTKDFIDIVKLIIIRYMISLIVIIFGTIIIYFANLMKEL